MEAEAKLGSPWSVLPIKNNKYARDLTEVHLSDRELSGVEHFEQFPNLEEIWLSNNRVSEINHNKMLLEAVANFSMILQLENLDGIASNFRCKQIMC